MQDDMLYYGLCGGSKRPDGNITESNSEDGDDDDCNFLYGDEQHDQPAAFRDSHLDSEEDDDIPLACLLRDCAIWFKRKNGC